MATNFVEKRNGVPAERTIAAYAVPGALFSPTELQLEPGLSEREWMFCLKKLDRVHESSGWWIGDCLRYGIQAFGKRVAFELGMQATGLGWETLRMYARICEKVPPERCRSGVAIMHYRIVEAFPPQKQDELIAEARELGLKSREFVAMVRSSEGDQAVSWNAVRKGRPTYPRGKHSVRLFLDRELYERVRELAQNMTIEDFLTALISGYLRAAVEVE